jgi:hypothetical protein
MFLALPEDARICGDVWLSSRFSVLAWHVYSLNYSKADGGLSLKLVHLAYLIAKEGIACN